MSLDETHALDDHDLASTIAVEAGQELLDLRDTKGRRMGQWQLRDEGDRIANELLFQRLEAHRPDDIIMSEEAPDNRKRLEAERVWIIDPLDGTSSYPYPTSAEWAVHVALVESAKPTAAAVAIPMLDAVFATNSVEPPGPTERDRPLVISGRSNPGAAAVVVDRLDGDLTTCGSSGVKAMLVVNGTVDVYVHATELWEWDVCAPAAVAAAAGLRVSNIYGNEIVYNKDQPLVPGLVIARPEFAEDTLKVLAEIVR